MTSTTPSFLPLSQTSLHPKYLARCRRAGIFSLAQMIRIPPRELANQLKLENEETEKILDSLIGGMVPKVMCLGGGGEQASRSTHTYGSADRVAEAGFSQSKTSMRGNLASSSKLTTGTPSLDAMLGGGFNVGQLAELVGESSTGKSQLICQLAVSTALGLGGTKPGSVALMASEGDAQGSTFVNRMVQIVKARKRMVSPRSSSEQVEDNDAGVEVKQLLRNVHIASIRDLDALDHVLEYTLPGLAHRLLEEQRDGMMDPSSSSSAPMASSSLGPRPPLRLVILDNLPSLFYAAQPTSGNKNLMFSRGMSLNGIADSLKRIARIGSGLDLSPPPLKNEFKGDADAAIKLEALAENKIEEDVIDGTPRQEDWPRLPQEHQLPVSGGSAVVVINHVSDAFERDLQSMRDIAITSSDSSRRGPTTRSGEPPLAYAEQAPYFSGLMDSFSSATSLTDASSSEDGPKPAATHGPFATRGMSMLLQEMDPLEGGNTGAKQAALGHVWNNCINARVMLCKTGRRVRREAIDDEGESHGTQRGTQTTVLRELGLPLMQASLVFSPDSAPSSSLGDVQLCHYVLTSSGLHGLPTEVVQKTLLPRSHDRDEPEEEENEPDIKIEPPSKRWKKEESFGDSAMQGVLGGQDLEAIMGAFESA